MAKVIHFEIHASDPPALISFYSALFGWEFRRWGDMSYWLIQTEKEPSGGIGGGLVLRKGSPPPSGAPVSGYICTIQVAALDDVVAQAQKLGGTVALPRAPIPGVGWLAYIKDPDGNIFGLMQTDPAAK